MFLSYLSKALHFVWPAAAARVWQVSTANSTKYRTLPTANCQPHTYLLPKDRITSPIHARLVMASKANTPQYPPSINPPLLPLSESAFGRPLPASSTFHSLMHNGRPLFSSHTWTSTSGDLGLLKDADEVEDRAIFVQEYNRLAKKVVGALFDYYCHMDKSGADISGTVRSATLPLHIHYSAHDVASTLKRLLSTLPGGILGSLLLFDSFIAIQSQLNAEPEFPRTNQTKVRARLIALAIGTIESQYRRELICAIFGLLSMIGRIAEVAPREDESGLPLPTTDLMGYGALSICFGPLLIGDLLASYTMKIAALDSGLILLPPATQQIRKDTRKNRPGSSIKNVQPAVDKILIANRVTEMLISNWRDIVRQMKSLGTHRRRHTSGGSFSRPSLRPSASEAFLTKIPSDFPQIRPSSAVVTRNTTEDADFGFAALNKPPIPAKRASGFLRQKASVNTLSPTIEESPKNARVRNEAVIEEETGPGKHFMTPDAEAKPKANRSTMTEGTQTEMGSPVKRKRFTVPPRLSSIDSLNQPRPEAADGGQIHPSSKDQVLGKDETRPPPKREPNRRVNSGQDTPPQFYSPAMSAPVSGEMSQETPSGTKTENIEMFPGSAQGTKAVPPRMSGAQSPATDSKYQLKRYKRKNYEPLTGSPIKGRGTPSPGEDVAHGFGMVSTPSDIESGSGMPKTGKGSHPNSPVKTNPRKLKRSRSGPLADSTTRKYDDVFKPNQCAPVVVWRNGVLQKSPQAKVLRSSVSDGVSLRASAIKSLINAGKSRIKHSQASSDKKRGPYNDHEEPDSWATCCQEGLPMYKRPESIIRHLNVCHGYKLSPELHPDSEAGTEDKRRDETCKLRQDVGMWRRRAESAEKRVLVFERFTERLKGIRDAAIASEQPGWQESEQQGDASASGLKLDNEYVAAAARVRFATVDGKEEQATPGETVPEQRNDGPRTSAESRRSKTCTECGEEPKLGRRAPVGQQEGGLRPRPASIDEVAELWMAAKELLDMDRNEDT
ncbi:Rho GTPase activation protein [Cordyceps militaris CM01]|uniref:Rho GTPase activation protein n=1 Tax=Cordyceps militaris (strain CM01) TaxID=983644 RepID=G3JU87_CORMM|nr:Rho GTPase activation protein [Cordyceps militaris CM01]EGX87794.1 Rho GTPase activation protein [Cordyceps militaris CM01]